MAEGNGTAAATASGAVKNGGQSTEKIAPLGIKKEGNFYVVTVPSGMTPQAAYQEFARQHPQAKGALINPFIERQVQEQRAGQAEKKAQVKIPAAWVTPPQSKKEIAAPVPTATAEKPAPGPKLPEVDLRKLVRTLEKPVGIYTVIHEEPVGLYTYEERLHEPPQSTIRIRHVEFLRQRVSPELEKAISDPEFRERMMQELIKSSGEQPAPNSEKATPEDDK